MWSSISIPGSPRILMVDATQNRQGWEYAFSDRLYQGLKKTGLEMGRNEPLKIQHPSELNRIKDLEFNCLLLLADLRNDALNAIRSLDHAPYLFAVYFTDGFDQEISNSILKVSPAIAPMSAMSAREAGLFYLKFFTELKLHSTDSISGKMVWFSFSKAKELLKRRRYTAKFGVRC